MRSEKRVTYKDETMASTSSSDAKIDSLVRKMERMMERINLNEKKPPRENQPKPKNRNRNQNFRRDPPQIRQRENDQKIRPHFLVIVSLSIFGRVSSEVLISIYVLWIWLVFLRRCSFIQVDPLHHSFHYPH